MCLEVLSIHISRQVYRKIKYLKFYLRLSIVNREIRLRSTITFYVYMCMDNEMQIHHLRAVNRISMNSLTLRHHKTLFVYFFFFLSFLSVIIRAVHTAQGVQLQSNV